MLYGVSVFATRYSVRESISDSVMSSVWLSGPKLRYPSRSPQVLAAGSAARNACTARWKSRLS